MKTEQKIERLILKLRTSSDTSAVKTMKKLCQIGRQATPQLLKAANDLQEPLIRKWSLQVLGQLGDPRGLSVLIKALKDERMTVRLHALRGLARLKNRKCTKAVMGCLRDPSGGIRVNALYTLIELKATSSLPQIGQKLTDPEWYVRQTACLALGVLNGRQYKKKLSVLATDDERKAVRLAASKALMALS